MTFKLNSYKMDYGGGNDLRGPKSRSVAVGGQSVN
jgi:hypothetical protein